MKKILLLSLVIFLLLASGCGKLNPFNKNQPAPQQTSQDQNNSDAAAIGSPQSAQPFSINIPEKSFNQNMKITGKVDPNYRIFINDKESVVDPSGSFTADVTLAPGSNQFTFRAVSSDGKSVYTTSKSIEYDVKPKLEITQFGQTTGNQLTIEGTTDPNSIVDANGNKTQADENGKFKLTFTSDGTSAIKIVATNKAGKSTFVQKDLSQK